MSPNPIKVLEDRIEFKFYAAEKYLKDLKELDAKRNDSMISKWKDRVGDDNGEYTVPSSRRLGRFIAKNTEKISA
jgi:hypothetical protein